ncbi:hypothetical protein CMI47_16125 [Candidatus Pacearchaeota archaeon]|nr:hypothetical protein [Candidatus Pacearchaeota archaeon]MAG27066.1 hypothetical protein [Candidatus Pacearchaeota archaeon]|tara:strand:+ start:2370 stop:2675 length:306 start_codon:yes stop_codon:yes gene_type:complete
MSNEDHTWTVQLDSEMHCLPQDDWRAVVREKAYMENEIAELKSKIKSSEYDCAELVKENALLLERTKKLAQRQPSWPKGYRPHHRRPGSVMLKEKVIGRRS